MYFFNGEEVEILHGPGCLLLLVPSLDISQFLGQLLGLCQMGAPDTPSAPTAGYVVQAGKRPWMEQLRKLGHEYHSAGHSESKAFQGRQVA